MKCFYLDVADCALLAVTAVNLPPHPRAYRLSFLSYATAWVNKESCLQLQSNQPSAWWSLVLSQNVSRSVASFVVAAP